MAGGRPTDYTPELLEKAREYQQNCPDELPSVAGLAIVLGVARKTIYDWASQEDKEEFCNIVEALMSSQEKKLFEKGLKNEYNASIAKLMLSKHGYSDKQEIDHTTKGEKLEANPIIADLTSKLNEIHRSASGGGDGGSTSPLGAEAQNKE